MVVTAASTLSRSLPFRRSLLLITSLHNHAAYGISRWCHEHQPRKLRGLIQSGDPGFIYIEGPQESYDIFRNYIESYDNGFFNPRLKTRTAPAVVRLREGLSLRDVVRQPNLHHDGKPRLFEIEKEVVEPGRFDITGVESYRRSLAEYGRILWEEKVKRTCTDHPTVELEGMMHIKRYISGGGGVRDPLSPGLRSWITAGFSKSQQQVYDDDKDGKEEQWDNRFMLSRGLKYNWVSVTRDISLELLKDGLEEFAKLAINCQALQIGNVSKSHVDREMELLKGQLRKQEEEVKRSMREKVEVEVEEILKRKAEQLSSTPVGEDTVERVRRAGYPTNTRIMKTSIAAAPPTPQPEDDEEMIVYQLREHDIFAEGSPTKWLDTVATDTEENTLPPDPKGYEGELEDELYDEPPDRGTLEPMFVDEGRAIRRMISNPKKTEVERDTRSRKQKKKDVYTRGKQKKKS